ncbi:hypothetical protein RYX36_005594 [Vicia faba]
MYGGSVKAPKILVDIVESIVVAVYVDVDFNLKRLWVIIRGLLESIVTQQDLEQKSQPVTMLYEICQKNDIVRLEAAKAALHKLQRLLPATTMVPDCCVDIDGNFKIEVAKQKLYAICGTKKWPRPVYSIEKDEGTPQDKIFVSVVQIAIPAAILKIPGDEKSRAKDEENSTTFLIIWALQQHKYL